MKDRRAASEQPVAHAETPHVSQGSVHLDAVRGAAALLVFSNHTRALYYSSALSTYDAKDLGKSSHPRAESSSVDEVLSGEIKLASEAVIIFFVLSGYLVGGSVLRLIEQNRWSWRVYLTKRLSRLYIVLLPAIILGVALDHLGMHLFGPASVYSTPPGIQLVATYQLQQHLRSWVVLGNALFLQGILVPDVGSNVSIWSLANEFWYYIMFPPLVFAFAKARQVWIRLSLLAFVLLLLWFTGLKIAILFPLWIMGALISRVSYKLTEKQTTFGITASLICLLTAMVGVRLVHMRAILADYVIAVPTCFFIFCAAQQHIPAKNSVYKAVAGFFSRISYSLYLFHLPLAIFLCGLLNNPWRPWHLPMHLGKFLVAEVCVLLCVYGLWRTFEAKTDTMRIFLFEREKGSNKPRSVAAPH